MVNISLTEEMVQNPPICHRHITGPWRMFRIEYGFECGCPEGRIWTPLTVDPDKLEAALREALSDTTE